MKNRLEKFILFYLGNEQYALSALSCNKFIEFEKQYYFGRQEIMAIFEHESFENKEGEKLPYMSIIYHEIMNPEYIFTNKLKFLLFGDDYTEHVSPEMLTDEKLLEAVRMLKEVY